MTTYCKSQAQADAEMLEWLATSLGKSFPNKWGNQCAAYSGATSVAMFGRPWSETLGYGNAIDHIDAASTTYFDKIWNNPNDPNQLPGIGWITCYTGAAPLWDGRYYGHTGVTSFISATSQTQHQQDGAAPPTFLHTDGNYYSRKPVHKATFLYVGDPAVGNIRGWLRPKWQKVVYTGADTRGYGVTSKATASSVVKAAVIRPMDGVDVSNWQYSKRAPAPALDATKVPAGFVGVLATDGKWANPDMDTALRQAKKSGKKLLVYHYARVSESDSDTQAKLFLKKTQSWIAAGAVPVLDWEEDAWNHRADWAIDWIKYVEKQTGKQCVVYQRQAAAAHASWGSFRRPMWLSWYGSTADMNGYATDFRGMPSVPGWKVAMWQYSDHGRLPGYDGYLDLNHYFGGIPQWDTVLAVAPAAGSFTLEGLLTMPQADFDREKKKPLTPAWFLANGRDHSYMARREIAGLPNTILSTKVKRPDGSAVTLKDVIAYDRPNWQESRENQKQLQKSLEDMNASLTKLITLLEGDSK